MNLRGFRGIYIFCVESLFASSLRDSAESCVESVPLSSLRENMCRIVAILKKLQPRHCEA